MTRTGVMMIAPLDASYGVVQSREPVSGSRARKADGPATMSCRVSPVLTMLGGT